MTARSTGGPAPQTVRRVHHSAALDAGVRVGLVAYGLVHLVIAWIALQLSWTHQQHSASASGAVHDLAGGTLGTALLWVAGVGLVALAGWQVFEAGWGHVHLDGAKRVFQRVKSVGRAVVYLVLAVTFFKALAGSSGSSSNKRQMTARLLHMSGGQVVVAVIGAAVVAVGLFQIVKGATRRFTKDLGPAASTGVLGAAARRLGRVGYIAKGISLAVVGGLFIWAAASYNPKKAGGLDVALKTVLDQAYGPWLLSLVALGIACFGVYCLVWARDPKT
ncbi:MAG: DUF1206 domain-containing protein [Nocardioidaceae bacterium]